MLSKQTVNLIQAALKPQVNIELILEIYADGCEVTIKSEDYLLLNNLYELITCEEIDEKIEFGYVYIKLDIKEEAVAIQVARAIKEDLLANYPLLYLDYKVKDHRGLIN